jgi:hypothetical protein
MLLFTLYVVPLFGMKRIVSAGKFVGGFARPSKKKFKLCESSVSTVHAVLDGPLSEYVPPEVTVRWMASEVRPPGLIATLIVCLMFKPKPLMFARSFAFAGAVRAFRRTM